MDFPTYETLLTRLDGNVLTITLNMPDKLNAATPKMHGEILRALRDLEGRYDIDVVVLTGAGRAFCAGGDVGHNLKIHDDQHRVLQEMGDAKRVVQKLVDCEQIMVCRMNGDAIGFGATLALFCDIIIAVDSARISDGHVKVGLVAGDGGAIIWPQLVGYAKAKQYLLTGDMLDAKEAERIGLINFAVPEAELDPLVDKWVRRFATGPRKAVRWSKRAINAGLSQLAHGLIDASVGYEGLSLLSDDLVEGVKSFEERRRPKFTGR
ncbi:MAG: enoyl-CoA hydratase/isomerase family protein [Gammaproteobacteria bacterium]